MKKRSPVRVEKRAAPLPGMAPLLSWTCDEANLRTAQFQNRRQPQRTAIVHRSTKGPGWQTTFFEDGVPTSDFQSATCRAGLRDLGPRSWRLRKVVR